MTCMRRMLDVREESFPDGLGQQSIGVQPLNHTLRVGSDGAEVGGGFECEARADEVPCVAAEETGGLFANEPEEVWGVRRPAARHDDDASTEAFAGGTLERELAEIHGGQGPAAVIEKASHAGRGGGQGTEFDQRQDFDDAAGLQRVTIFAKLEEQEEHGSGSLELEAGDAGL